MSVTAISINGGIFPRFEPTTLGRRLENTPPVARRRQSELVLRGLSS